MKMIDTKPINFRDAETILTKIEKDKVELGYEQKITLDYLRTRTILDDDAIKTVTEELSKIEGLKDHQISAIINMLPADEDDVNVLFMKERIKLENDKVSQIAKIIKDALISKEKKK